MAGPCRPATRSRRALRAGDPVRRYNQIIGFATTAIAPGQHVHSHNLAFGSFERDHAAGADARQTDRVRRRARHLRRHRARRRPRRDAQLRRRADLGQLLGHRRAGDCRPLPPRPAARCALAPYPNVDGVVALTHGGGCATSERRRAAAPAAAHAGRLRAVCQLRRAARRRPGLRDEPDLRPDGAGGPDRGRPAADLQHPGHRRHGEDGRPRHRTRSGCSGPANRVHRQPVPASHLVVGLQCGGSDGYSGISANPALARRSIAWCATAARRSFRVARGLRRRAPADAPRRRGRWPTSSSRGCAGGSATASATTARWTTTFRRQQGRRPDDDPRRAWARSPRAARPTSSTSSSTPNA